MIMRRSGVTPSTAAYTTRLVCGSMRSLVSMSVHQPAFEREADAHRRTSSRNRARRMQQLAGDHGHASRPRRNGEKCVARRVEQIELSRPPGLPVRVEVDDRGVVVDLVLLDVPVGIAFDAIG